MRFSIIRNDFVKSFISDIELINYKKTRIEREAGKNNEKEGKA